MPSSSAQFTAQMCPCPTPVFFFFLFVCVCVCVQVHFIRRVLGRLPCSLLHLLWKYFIGDVFGRPPAPRSGLAWLIIKCLSCQALQQHPNLFWQPVLHIHSQTSSTHTRERTSASTYNTLSTDIRHDLCTQVLQTVYQSRSLLGPGINALGRGRMLSLWWAS